MRKILSIIICVVLLFTVCPVFTYAAADVKVTVNGKAVTFNVAPMIQNNTLYVPAKQFGEMLGMTGTLSTGKLVLKQGSTTIIILTNSREYTVNGIKDVYANERNELLSKPLVKSNTIMIPFNTLPKVLGLQARWDASTMTATVLTGKYIDLSPADESYPFMLDMIGKGAISASGNKVNPTAACTVEQFLKIFLTAAGYKPTGTYRSWSEPYINEAIKRGLVVKGEFTSYSKAITNIQAMRIAVRSTKETYALNLSAYSAKIKDYWSAVDTMRPYMLKAYTHGIVSSSDGYLRPNDPMKRYEACMITGKTIDTTKRNFMIFSFIKPDITIKVNKKTVTLPTGHKAFYDFQGSIQVPIDLFAPEIGANWRREWDDKLVKTIYTVQKNDKTLVAYSYSKNYSVDGTKKQLATATDTYAGTYTYFDLKELAYALGATEYKVDVAKNSVYIAIPDTTGKTAVENAWSAYKNPNIPQRLYDIAADNEKANILEAHYSLVQRTSDYFCEQLASLARGYIETMNNINYTNVPASYKTQLLNYFDPECTFDYNGKTSLSPSAYVDEYIADFKTNKIIQEAKFITDPSLVYNHKDGFAVVRGTLYFRFGESSNKDWLWKCSTVGKWYQMDMEVQFYLNLKNKTCYRKEYYLNSAKVMEDKIDD